MQAEMPKNQEVLPKAPSQGKPDEKGQEARVPNVPVSPKSKPKIMAAITEPGTEYWLP